MPEGFARMDVSTRIHQDPKFRRLARAHPDLVTIAFLAYLATLAESWADGARVPVEDAWPAIVPYQPAAVEAMREVGLLDQEGRIAPPTWDHWYGEVARRREQNRERWRESARSRRGHTAGSNGTDSDDSPGSPRGHPPVSPTSVPIRSVPSVNPPAPQGGARKRTNGTNPRASGDSPRQVQERHDRRAPEYLGNILDRAAREKGVIEW